jgi:hypothetical protein
MFDKFFRNREVTVIRRWQQEQYDNRWLYTGVDLFVCASTGVMVGLLLGAALILGAR